jgi:hypothetical protein
LRFVGNPVEQDPKRQIASRLSQGREEMDGPGPSETPETSVDSCCCEMQLMRSGRRPLKTGLGGGPFLDDLAGELGRKRSVSIKELAEILVRGKEVVSAGFEEDHTERD